MMQRRSTGGAELIQNESADGVNFIRGNTRRTFRNLASKDNSRDTRDSSHWFDLSRDRRATTNSERRGTTTPWSWSGKSWRSLKTLGRPKVRLLRRKGFARKTVNLAAANGCGNKVERHVKLKFVRDGKRCMQFVDADVKRPWHRATETLAKETQFSDTWNRVFTCRKNGVFTLQLETRSDPNESGSGFRWAGLRRDCNSSRNKRHLRTLEDPNVCWNRRGRVRKKERRVRGRGDEPAGLDGMPEHVRETGGGGGGVWKEQNSTEARSSTIQRTNELNTR